ncbi:NitT/TauT family transport system permease protein [Psychrobacillus psychrotolerans]|uniref:NitT/TauT family transport system permease protein n=2 Tax=Psychrobacillus psychrotolerans TaxID=126156 RepID=A0A1I5Z797_9BACI|nr:ABC transporter permease [Psychrobacillus psychrotolerans]SFQ52321.1 NitT/TauT family transport system permease protein [Psychrobacillus psychrotolerans]
MKRVVKIVINQTLKTKNKSNVKKTPMTKSNWVEKIPSNLWVLISLVVAIFIWTILSIIPNTSRSFPNIFYVSESVVTMMQRGVFWSDIASSLISVLVGFLIGFVISLPVAVLMAWYRPIRFIIEPWIQFVRNIPPLAYVPLVVISAGVGRTPQIIVITIATFLTMSITIYQGVRNIDPTLIKAARVLGAKDKDIFLKVIAPASLPFIMTAIRLGTAIGLTSLIAAESTGASAGLGMRIRALNNTFEASPMLLYIIVIGVIGLIFERLVKLLERRLTGWQEKRE